MKKKIVIKFLILGSKKKKKKKNNRSQIQLLQAQFQGKLNTNPKTKWQISKASYNWKKKKKKSLTPFLDFKRVNVVKKNNITCLFFFISPNRRKPLQEGKRVQIFYFPFDYTTTLKWGCIYSIVFSYGKYRSKYYRQSNKSANFTLQHN